MARTEHFTGLEEAGGFHLVLDFQASYRAGILAHIHQAQDFRTDQNSAPGNRWTCPVPSAAFSAPPKAAGTQFHAQSRIGPHGSHGELWRRSPARLSGHNNVDSSQARRSLLMCFPSFSSVCQEPLLSALQSAASLSFREGIATACFARPGGTSTPAHLAGTWGAAARLVWTQQVGCFHSWGQADFVQAARWARQPVLQPLLFPFWLFSPPFFLQIQLENNRKGQARRSMIQVENLSRLLRSRLFGKPDILVQAFCSHLLYWEH